MFGLPGSKSELAIPRVAVAGRNPLLSVSPTASSFSFGREIGQTRIKIWLQQVGRYRAGIPRGFQSPSQGQASHMENWHLTVDDFGRVIYLLHWGGLQFSASHPRLGLGCWKTQLGGASGCTNLGPYLHPADHPSQLKMGSQSPYRS